MKKVRKHFIFTGRVQGVGFRYSALYIAQSIGVTGWVKNEWDGTVVLEAQGTEEELDVLVQKLRSRSFIHIDYVSEIEIPLQQESGFHVR
ncbi:acylphosphatase [Bariatricus massiliensis]|uniref:acylphosphatase n=1 Tax=Bariatricus massiliensis TaxID=1745713 RepID=A0ABS8DM72_9FIRM|nr:acylphosphatase [Bariatricus massiliensis]MCB7306390.1 acylphosphatase [Bariatricus massiliensis]MCB7376811.1 acylphosphatase [Bariatricus massiliensis]MCB7389470.1 acylphosphatase [Bariatricus massiliensis]MCB7413640.1 acylphosphatase [Bariatricus massiliensis]MCQ5255527.1 acylphosphatase [Bariatricus massiliensis]